MSPPWKTGGQGEKKPPLPTNWLVSVKGRRPVKVSADYQVVEGGTLIFRNRAYAYPETVMVFAAGEWVTVENKSIPEAPIP